jgi:hypothetical protein
MGKMRALAKNEISGRKFKIKKGEERYKCH